jgi:aminoglycoside 6-adenylyltransferase
MHYDQWERDFVTWARARSDIRAAIVVGSRARLDHPADEWSDLDLILFTTNPSVYVAQTGWLNELGEVWVTVLNHTGHDPEWLVMFADGLKVDFALAAVPEGAGSTADLSQLVAASREKARMPPSKSGGGIASGGLGAAVLRRLFPWKKPRSLLRGSSPYQAVLQRGVRVLFDRNDPQAKLTLPLSERGSPAHPKPDEFLAVVNHVLLYAARTARFLRRGELWRAKRQCDGDLKQRLLTMLEWHARATKGLEHDTWYDGRFLEEWADPRAIATLPETFATYDKEDLWRALFATLDLFRWLAAETAELLGYAYPALAEDRVTEWIRSAFVETGLID